MLLLKGRQRDILSYRLVVFDSQVDLNDCLFGDSRPNIASFEGFASTVKLAFGERCWELFETVCFAAVEAGPVGEEEKLWHPQHEGELLTRG